MHTTDLRAVARRLRPGVEARWARVYEHGRFILGPEVLELEAQLAEYVGAPFCVTCANGTDALELALRAAGIGSGHAVLVPAFTFVATANAVVAAGATPVFVDVTDDFLVDPASVALMTSALRSGQRRDRWGKRLVPKAVVAVGLFGMPVAAASVEQVAADLGLEVIEDGAQSLGAGVGGQVSPASFALGTTSFFPTKPLGCFGDGGAVFVDSEERLFLLRSLREQGRGVDKGVAERFGRNSRLDTLQAAVLLARLETFDEELRQRRRIAQRYQEALAPLETYGLRLPCVALGVTPSWAQFVVRVPLRDQVQKDLEKAHVPTRVYYRVPLHLHAAFSQLGYGRGDLPMSERLADQVLALPLHPDLSEQDQARVVDELGRMLRH